MIVGQTIPANRIVHLDASQNVCSFRNRDLDQLVMTPRTTVFIQKNKNTEYFLVPNKKTVDSEGKRVKRGGGGISMKTG